MYKYNFVKTEDFCSIFKKAQRRLLFHNSLFRLLLIDVILSYALWYTICKLNKFNYTPFFSSIILLIVFQILAYTIFCNKISSNKIDNYNTSELTISFSENGLTISSDNSLNHITWGGVENIKVYNDYLLINYKITTAAIHIFIFKGLDVSKDIIISEIEKYKKVKWC